ncbi:putative RNA-directed DNA polymerase [Rosa chinensis]|uniref:Putative RNA-directed DNA polymerase n=1 Tax=Rosa chinensis TaxID=74649 RepID=A0A2P6R232_ROSCH|nr:putative RNA-directed DNA polymerase [Rosa chinensis]
MMCQDLATKEQIGEGFYLNGLYYLSKDFRVPKASQANLSLAQEHQLWHQRLAHPSEHVLSSVFPNLCKESFQCEICHLAKSTRLPFGSSVSRARKPFEIVHSDIWGPAPLDSFDGYKYFVTFVDDFSRISIILSQLCSQLKSTLSDQIMVPNICPKSCHNF